MKVVSDTNIYVSAFVIPNSQAEKAILKVIEGDDLLIISKEIINEILTVLSRKFALTGRLLAAQHFIFQTLQVS